MSLEKALRSSCSSRPDTFFAHTHHEIDEILKMIGTGKHSKWLSSKHIKPVSENYFKRVNQDGMVCHKPVDRSKQGNHQDGA